jgi:hypothetical protein
MKQLIILIGFLVVLVSCEKEVIYPTDHYTKLPSAGGYDTTNIVSNWGKFLLIDAVMYIDNSETGQKTSFNHFGTNKTVSSLRWGGSLFDIETIIKDVTTYSFWNTPTGGNGMGRFVLNDDTSKYYMVNYMGSYTSIIEDPIHGQQNLGGSARPFNGYTISKSDMTVSIQIQEMEGNIGGYNCHYWTQLKFKKIQSW